jgi:type IV pilus assembly protein PilB
VLEQELLAAKVLTRDQLDYVRLVRDHRARLEGKNQGLVEVARELRVADEARLKHFLETSTGSAELIRLDVPVAVCRRMNIRVEGVLDGVLRVQSISPLHDADKAELVSLVNGKDIRCYAVEEVMGSHRAVIEALSRENVDAAQLAADLERFNHSPESGDVSAARLLTEILHDAIEKDASDIHISRSDGLRPSQVAYRVAGIKRVHHIMVARAASALFGHLKTAGGMDLAERRRPQDGRMSTTYQGRQIDVRMSVMPTVDGEKAVMRLLDPAKLKPLPMLYADHPAVLERLLRLMATQDKAAGLIFVTGPTGSGKSTTLYSGVSAMDRQALNVVSIEDPVEQIVPGVEQSAVNEASGMSFSKALRAYMRQDPDVIVIGETRDSETMSLLCQAADTGHLCLTSMHTPDVAGTYLRAGDLLPFENRATGMRTVADCTRAVLNQKLVRRLCGCHEPIRAGAHPDPRIQQFAIDYGLADGVVGKATGCPSCKDTGYLLSRVQVPEALFIPNDPTLHNRIAELLAAHKPGEISSLPGVFFYSRLDAVRRLLASKTIDLPTALGVLGEKTA